MTAIDIGGMTLSVGGPRYHRELRPGLEVLVDGRPNDWSEIRDKPQVRLQLLRLMTSQGVRLAFAPDPRGFNTLIGGRQIRSEFKLVTDQHAALYHGAELDGYRLEEPGAVAIATGDCPTIIAYLLRRNHPVVVAHAGFDSLIDRARWDPQVQRQYRVRESVLDVLLQHFPRETWSQLRFFVAAGIGNSFSYPVDHPVYGTINRLRLQYLRGNDRYRRWPIVVGNPDEGRISLLAIIRAQLATYDIQPEQVEHDGLDTATDRSLWSHSRWAREQKGPDGRNLVLVISR